MNQAAVWHRAHDPRWLLLVSTAVAFTLSGIVLTWTVADEQFVGLPVQVSWWHIALVVAVTEQAAWRYESRRQVEHQITFTEVPMVVGLVFAAPWQLLVGRAAGGIVGHLIGSRRSLNGAVFSAATGTFTAGIALVLFHTVPVDQFDDPVAWFAAFTGVVGAQTVYNVAANVATHVKNGQAPDGEARDVMAVGALSTVVNAALGTAAAVMLWSSLWTVWIIGVVLAVMIVGRSRFETLMQQNRDLAALSQVVRDMPVVERPERVAGDIVRAAVTVVRAETAALVLNRLPEGVPPMLVSGTGGELRELTLSQADADQVMIDLLDTGRLLPVEGWDPSRSSRVPVERNGDLIGVLAVCGRTPGRLNDQDRDLLQALAVQAGLRLDRSNLISELQREAADRERQATHDDVTGALNERGLRERIDQALSTARPTGQPVAVLTVEIGTYQEVIGTFGDDIGHQFDRSVFRRLVTTARGSVIGRVAPGRFTLMLPVGTSATDALTTAERLTQVLADPVVTDTVTLPSSARIGVAVFPNDAGDSTELVRKAGIALVGTGRTGTTVERYSASTDPTAARPLAIAATVRSAVEHDELEVHYQPKKDLRTGTFCGAEALIRWTDPSLGPVNPDELLVAAERTGVIHSLTRWVLDRAIRDTARWVNDEGLDLRVSVNVSATNLLDVSLPDVVARLLDEHNLNPGRLIVEITESAVLTDSPRAVSTVTALRDVGVGVSVDDFGTGFSSLSHLRALPVTEVKIDRQFVQNVTVNPDDRAFVESIIGLGHRLGLEVTAEGVETERTERMLRSAGCDLAQGYLYARALPADTFPDWVREQANDSTDVPDSAAADVVVPIRWPNQTA